MKFAFTTLACPGWTIEEVAEAARQLGYDGVELRLLDGAVINPVADRVKVIQAVNVLRGRGVEVCALDSSCTFNHADEARARQVADLKQWINLAQHVRVPIVRVFGGGGDPGAAASAEESTGWVTTALRDVAPYAEQAGVTVALETHDAFSSARRVAHVLDAVGSRHVAVLWDSESPYRAGETTEDVIDLLGPRIAHVHVKDGRRAAPTSADWQLVLLGEGEVPVRELLQALERAGFTGYVSVEWEKKWHPELAEPEIALPQHIGWLKQATSAAT